MKPGDQVRVKLVERLSDARARVAEVDSGRAQKYRPRPGANPAFLVAKPVNPAWQ